MFHLKPFLICILITLTGLVEGSVIPDAPFSMGMREVPRQPQLLEVLGPHLPNDTVYVPFNAINYDIAIGAAEVASLFAPSFDACLYEAKKRGGNFFEFKSNNKCNIALLRFPFCRSRTGKVSGHVMEKFLSNGTLQDGTIVDPLRVGLILWGLVPNAGDGYRSYRVVKPTIFNVQSSYVQTSPNRNQFIFPEDGTLSKVDANVVTDPTCYTNSSCGVPFVYPLSKVIQSTKYLQDYCGTVVHVSKGEELHLLSHVGIGCKVFTNEGYPADPCHVNYRGFAPLKITLTYTDFVGNDTCDGFYIGIVAFSSPDNRTLTRLCTNPVTEIASPLERGRIDFKGTAVTGRPKYGFVIKISYA